MSLFLGSITVDIIIIALHENAVVSLLFYFANSLMFTSLLSMAHLLTRVQVSIISSK